MRIQHIVVAGAISLSIASGVVAGINQPAPLTLAAGSSSRSVKSTHGRTIDPYQQQANLKVPMLSEDRYVNGAWTTPQTPPSLPGTSGQCGEDSGIDC